VALCRTLPLLPELVDGLHPSPEPIDGNGLRMRVALSMRLLGLDRTFHGGRSGYINSRLAQAVVRMLINIALLLWHVQMLLRLLHDVVL